MPDGAAIRQALEEAMGRCDLLIVTGGLGPTSDDLTRDLTAELLGLPMHEDAEVLEAIGERFQRRKLHMPASLSPAGHGA